MTLLKSTLVQHPSGEVFLGYVSSLPVVHVQLLQAQHALTPVNLTQMNWLGSLKAT